MAEGVMDFVDDEDLPSFDDWFAAASSALGEGVFEEELCTDLQSGIGTNPIYGKKDLTEVEDYPSLGLSRRASNPGGLLKGWDIRQRHWVTTPKDTNSTILRDLNRGANSIELVLPDPKVDALESILDGVLLDIAGIAPTCPRNSLGAASNFLKFLERNDLDGKEPIFDLSVDPVGELMRGAIDPDTLRTQLKEGGEIALRVQKDFRKGTTFRVSGLDYAEAGADPITELGAVISSMVTYLRSMDNDGLSSRDAFKQIRVVVSVGTDQFFDIAKIRALRVLLKHVAKACGVNDLDMRIQASTPQSLASKSDPWVNLLRTTVGCFAAAVGGADIVTLTPFDSAFGVPDNFGMRLARNTQLILMEESNIHRVIDPAGGSWYVESLTDQIVLKAWEKFQSFERNGGIVTELLSGSLQEVIAEQRESYREQLIRRERILIGVNDFLEPSPTDLIRKAYEVAMFPDHAKSSQFRVSDISDQREGGMQ